MLLLRRASIAVARIGQRPYRAASVNRLLARQPDAIPLTRERSVGQSIGSQQNSTTDDLPPPVLELVDELTAVPGAVAVVLGGSRAEGAADAASDWDLGLYYRGTIELGALERRGTVYPPGSWGRVMNGGAWLRGGGAKVDVLLRDLDVVEDWTLRATEGEFEVDALLGYVAGIPTYSLAAELATCRLLRGSIPRVALFPPAWPPRPRRTGASAVRSAWTMRGCTRGAATSSRPPARQRRRCWKRRTRVHANAACGCSTRSA